MEEEEKVVFKDRNLTYSAAIDLYNGLRENKAGTNQFGPFWTSGDLIPLIRTFMKEMDEA